VSLAPKYLPRSGVARLVAMLAVAVAALMSIVAASPSQAHAATTYEFQPVRLIVHDIEDGWPDWWDEPRMYYGNQVFATSVPNRGTVPGWQMPRERFTGSQLQVDLMERDGGWYDSNHLGTVFITPGPLGQERQARFGGPGQGWHYELVYRVVQASP
jgi:hypothetical protein